MFDGTDGAMVRSDEVAAMGRAAYTWTPSGDDWREVDRRLRGIAKRRGVLDADEAKWLREAERVQIWRPLGMVNMTDYMERVLGYGPRTAQKRLQVARALETLPVLTDALATGALPFSAVRELVRVATPTTEATWLAHVEDMNLRQIEEAVAGHRPGDLPADAPDYDAREHEITLRVNASAYATWRQGRTQLDAEHDQRLRTQARAALVTMGWKASIASAAVDQAQAQLPADATLEALIRAALRHCPLSNG
jgi:hypothetical protein